MKSSVFASSQIQDSFISHRHYHYISICIELSTVDIVNLPDQPHFFKVTDQFHFIDKGKVLREHRPPPKENSRLLRDS